MSAVVLVSSSLCDTKIYFKLPYQFIWSVFAVNRISVFFSGLRMIHADVGNGLCEDRGDNERLGIVHIWTLLYTKGSRIVYRRTVPMFLKSIPGLHQFLPTAMERTRSITKMLEKRSCEGGCLHRLTVWIYFCLFLTPLFVVPRYVVSCVWLVVL